MNLQYLTDSTGQYTGVFIPIKEWEHFKDKYEEFKKEEVNDFEIPEWQKEIINQRLKDYNENPDDVLDWDEVKNDFNFG